MIRWSHKFRKYTCIIGLVLAIGIALLMGPAATSLQMRSRWADQKESVDVVYLVCGARAQQRRLQAMHVWLHVHEPSNVRIWIGNDTQNSFWSRDHQRNLTRAEWAELFARKHFEQHDISIVPGAFANTDAEMAALAKALEQAPEIQTIAMVTCGFHARRALQRFTTHAPDSITAKIIPPVRHWENRAPWIVAAEWLKMMRDRVNLTHHRWLSRQPQETNQ